jgi:hypothetical protein
MNKLESLIPRTPVVLSARQNSSCSFVLSVPLTVLPHKTRVVVEVVTTFSSFRFPELSQPI